MNAPTQYQLQTLLAKAMQTLRALREEDGQVIETDDEALFALAEEGIDLETALRRIISAYLDAKANAAGADYRIDALTLRRNRFRRQEETYRDTIMAVMQAVGLRKWGCEEAGVFIANGRTGVRITDEDKIPDHLVTTTVSRAPRKADILAAITAGEDVPGAVLSNPMPTLTIRSR